MAVIVAEDTVEDHLVTEKRQHPGEDFRGSLRRGSVALRGRGSATAAAAPPGQRLHQRLRVLVLALVVYRLQLDR